MVVFEPCAFGEIDSDGWLFICLGDVVNNIVGQDLVVFVAENGGLL